MTDRKQPENDRQDSGRASLKRIDKSTLATQTIDLDSIFRKDVTSSGSFDTRNVRLTTFARLLNSLPLPVLMVDGTGKVVFLNEYWRGVDKEYERLQGEPFRSLFADPAAGEKAEEIAASVFQDRKQQVIDATLHMGANVMWTRVYFRSLRLGTQRLILVPIEDLTVERKRILLQEELKRRLEKTNDELEQRVKERTAELVSKNRELEAALEERDRAAKALKESEELFRAVFESAEDWIFIKNRELEYTQINPAMLDLVGKARPNVLGKTDRDLLPPDQAVNLLELEKRVLEGQTAESEHEMRFNGRAVRCQFMRVPLRDSSGGVRGLCGIGRDVTDRPKKEAGVAVRAGTSDDEGYSSAAMRRTLEQALLAAKSNSTVLLLGESGSGKDFLAQYLHDHSSVSSGPFFTINCAAVVPELAESELFGHERGAFTGSSRRKRGLLELAEGGTLLLNEIGELSPQIQAKLLTFLDTQSFTRVGGERTVSVSARILAATNRDLEQEVEAGRFRRDLYFRLNVFTLYVPPLRDRVEDIPMLVKVLITGLASKMGLRQAPTVDPEALDALCDYSWPGNVRELQNVLERALMLGGGGPVTVEHLGLSGAADVPSRRDGISIRLEVKDGFSMHDALQEAKRTMLTESLEISRGSIKEAARLLGISRDSFNHHIRSLGIRVR